MELFKETNFDFLRWKWPFIGASLVLSAAGLISLAINGGPKLGIEFKGGMEITVKFATYPGVQTVEKVRDALGPALSSTPTVQSISGGSTNEQNSIVIGTEGGSDQMLAKNRQIVFDTLAKTFGQPGSGKLDFNNATVDQLTSRLSGPLQSAGAQLSDQQVQDLMKALTARRDKDYSGLITNFDQLKGAPGLTPQVLTVLNQECYLAPYNASRDIQIVGPKVGEELRKQAVNATLLALAGMLVYIWFRFEWIYGVGAVIACLHDTIITIGLFSLFGKEITLTVIAALLTLVGYSMNDTIVIFDRIRENNRLNSRESLADLINRSVNQTLSRTVMTSGLTFLAVIALYLFGGPVLHGFAFALVVGILIGTYSSVFVASPIVLFWHNFADARKKTAPVVAPAPKPVAEVKGKKIGKVR
ncbi:MAG TPA: protein translocase subunit SecF [Bryobacteraceae bacterium]|nr:protein translocase subunit SecF [Bryobacteraceae bacterium]